jgi:hypothetical protein
MSVTVGSATSSARAPNAAVRVLRGGNLEGNPAVAPPPEGEATNLLGCSANHGCSWPGCSGRARSSGIMTGGYVELSSPNRAARSAAGSDRDRGAVVEKSHHDAAAEDATG